MSYIEPALPLLILVGLIAVVQAWRASIKSHRPWCLTISVLGIALLSMNVVAWTLSRPLEAWYSENPTPAGDADAIVVLSGSVQPPSPETPYALSGQDTYIRLQRAVWLFKNWKSVPILATGGGDDGKWYAHTMRHILEAEGIPSEMIWTEATSRSTHENAEYGSQVLRQHGVSTIALVVEASSMPRAAASFRKFGMSVVPAPARYSQLNWELNDFFPNWRAIALNGETLHEMVGIVWYKLRGWI